MLEGLVATLLNRFLGMYIRNFDPKQLNIGIWSGDVKLRDLELRREALDQLHLPINVVEGHLGQLTLQIPWSNLKGKPVKVFVEDVYLLAAPKEDAEYDEEEEAKRQHRVKIEKLESAEMLKERAGEGLSPEEQQKNQSFTDSLVTKIIDNLQVSVKNVHIRYEDSISTPGHPFALGFTLDELSAFSTDAEWNPTFIQTSTGVTHKLATLGALALYWDTDSDLLGTGKGAEVGAEAQGIDHKEAMDKFQSMIAKKDSPVPGSHQYVLKPVTGRARLQMDKTGKTDKPKLKSTLLFDEIGFVLDDNQYRDALMMIDLFHYFIRHQENKKYQPKGSTPKEDPRAWFRFAGDAILRKIHDRNRRWTWAYFRERRDQRIHYIELFKKKKKEQALSAAETEDYNKLEWDLSYEDLRFYRSLGRSQLRKENVGVKPAPQQQSWASWVWNAGKNPQAQQGEDTTMTEEQRKELYDAIEWDEKHAITESVDLPREMVKMQIEASLNTGSFTLRRDPHGKCTEVLRLVFDKFKASILQRPDSFLADLSLAGMRLYDGTTEGSLFPQIVHVKDAPDIPADQRIEELSEDQSEVEEKESLQSEDPFFQLQFEQNPLDGSADSAVNLKLKSMEVIYNPSFVVEIAKFFKPPERHMESIGALMESAGASVEAMRQQTRAGLEFALEEHKTINAKLDLQAPLIIIPDSVVQESTNCLIVDAGHVSMTSELVEKSTIKDIQAKQKQQYSDADWKQLENLMYDKFQLKLESTQVLIGTSIGETKAQLQEKDDKKNFHVVDRINIDFTVAMSILPKAPNLTRFRVSGNLPVLHASISDSKYKNLMKLLDVAIPKFDSDAAEKIETMSVQTTNTEIRREVRDNKDRQRERAKSFTFATQEALIFDEDEDEGKEPDHFEDAPNGQTEEDISLRQRNFEFTFTVDKLQGSLFKSDPEGRKSDTLLVELVAEHFQFGFYLRPFDMTAEVRLGSLNVEDYIERDPLPEFKRIITSEGFEADRNKDLFQVKFVKVKRESPEFQTTFEGIETNIDVSISTINVIVTRRTLLTLLDFVLITFTNPNAPAEEPKAVEDAHSSGDAPGTDLAEPEKSIDDPDKLRIKIDLTSIALILNNDGIRLATLSLNSADLGIFIMGKSMRIGGRLGNFSLIDDINQGAAEESSLRQLISIQGEELADFRYETFDPAGPSFPGYDSSIFLRSGSIKVNFVEEPFRKIMEFAVKFGKMQAIFNAARQAAMNQASNIQERANKMHFDIIVRTPIVVFPKVGKVSDQPDRDLVTAYLGEIYAQNEFVPLTDAKDSDVANKISTGIRNIRLTSEFRYPTGDPEILEMIDKVDVGFGITYVEHTPGLERPDMEIEGSMSQVNLRITQTQLKFLLELSRTVPAAFAGNPDDVDDLVQELPSSRRETAKEITSPERGDSGSSEPSASLSPELGVGENTWTKLDMIFKVPSIGLELVLAKEDEPLVDMDSASLSQFSLNNTNVKVRMISDGSLESELMIHDFSIKDSRKRDNNKFRKIMTSTNKAAEQFMASITISGGKEKNMIAILTIDSPRIIFALDYLFSISSFLSAGLAVDEPIEVENDLDESASEETESVATLQSDSRKSKSVDKTDISVARTEDSAQGGMSVSFRVNVVDALVILIANPTIGSSEAIVLRTKQVLLSQQHALTLLIDKVGMFLCRMDQFENSRLRILDDFSIQMSMDNRSQGLQSSLTSINIDVEPLVLRLSLRDILLAIQIVNKASELSGKDDSKSTEDTEPSKVKEIKGTTTKSMKRRSASGKALSTAAKQTIKTKSTVKGGNGRLSTQGQGSALMKREELTAHLDGFRLILIGGLHELPLVDFSVKESTVGIRDWSGAMTGDTSMDMYINIYNFSKSAWEPLIEPWQLGFHMSKDQNPDRLGVDLYSRKNMELTVTSSTIALASKAAQFLQSDEDVLSKPRGIDAPYRIRNHTGFDLHVWAENPSEEDGMATKLSDGEEAPWRFEDLKTMRETLSPEGNAGIVGVRLEGSGFDSVERIHVNREGEKIYALKPRKDKILHRLLVEVTLSPDNVKYITFRSPLLVENNTQIPVEIGVYSPEEGHLLKIEKIPPGEGRPTPVGACFMHTLLIRPDQGFGYSWSTEGQVWKELLRKPTRTVMCRSESANNAPPFYFQLNASFDKSNPLTSIYPYMRLRLSAPIEVQNLLPYDFKYRIYDKNTKKDWTNFLRKGGLSPVHVVELSHLLLLSIHMQDTVFSQSEFAIINSNNQDDFRTEDTLVLKDSQGLTLNLKLHYFRLPDSGGAFRVTIFSPYIVLNKTGMDVNIKSKTFLTAARSAAGQGMRTEASEEGSRRAKPYMFSYPTEDRANRALIKLGESAWSKPQSFDAIGSSYEVRLQGQDNRSEVHVGISVDQGEGKYKLTKVVTIAPRFVLKNKINEDINVREPGSSGVMTMKPGELLPLHFLRQAPEKQLCLCFPGMNNQWSSPFNISDVGSVHVKIAKAGQRQRLVRVEILMEDATLFLHISMETKNWPFSMRNESDNEFMFYQANPNINPNSDDDDVANGAGWRPIRYRLPPRSIMTYAWDYPAAKLKELIITANGRERHVKLAEIGNLLPMKIPVTPNSPHMKVIDINVAADGPTQTLVLSNYKASKSLYKQKSATSSQTSVSTGFEVKDIDTDVTFKAQLRLAGIGISLINSSMRELAYITFRELELKYSESKLYQTLNSTIKWIQIDNQLYGGIFPILLYPSVVPKTGKEMEAHPTFHAMITRVKDDSYGVLYIKYATLLLQQLTIEIDEDFIYALLDFSKVPGASWSEEHEGKLCDEEIDLPEPKQEQSGQDLYFELLHLQPAQLDLSFVRTERVNVEDKTSSSNPLMFFVNIMTMAIGNINDAPVRFNALMLENARVSAGLLTQNVTNHYSQEALYQVHKILGSADFLGNPVGLFNNISSGVADIFYEPYQGFIMTDRPQDLGLGIAKGATSFVKKSVFGVTDSMSKFTGSLSKGLAAATMDKQFQDRRRMARSRNRPKHALYGVTSGANSFATALASGVGGLARKPLEGAEQEGLGGFIKGVGKGFLGLATKPAIGALDLASTVTEGIRNTTTVFDQEGLDRVRLTRFIGQDGIVRPYAQREALGQFWLKQLDNGKYFDESYIAHLELPREDVVVMLTYDRIMLIKSKKLTSEWDVPLKDIQTIAKERTGLTVTLKGGTNGPFIPVQDETQRNFLYQKIGVAVNSFNASRAVAS